MLESYLFCDTSLLAGLYVISICIAQIYHLYCPIMHSEPGYPFRPIQEFSLTGLEVVWCHLLGY